MKVFQWKNPKTKKVEKKKQKFVRARCISKTCKGKFRKMPIGQDYGEKKHFPNIRDRQCPVCGQGYLDEKD